MSKGTRGSLRGTSSGRSAKLLDKSHFVFPLRAVSVSSQVNPPPKFTIAITDLARGVSFSDFETAVLHSWVNGTLGSVCTSTWGGKRSQLEQPATRTSVL